MKKFCYISLLFFILIQLGTKQLNGQPSRSHKGFDMERIKQINQVIEKSIQNSEIPGAVVLVAKHGKIAFYKNYGYANIASQKSMELNSIFRIASMTKAITTVGVMILYERGYFLLNDPISKFIPEFKKPSILAEVDSVGNIVKTIPSKRKSESLICLLILQVLVIHFFPQIFKKHIKRVT